MVVLSGSWVGYCFGFKTNPDQMLVLQFWFEVANSFFFGSDQRLSMELDSDSVEAGIIAATGLGGFVNVRHLVHWFRLQQSLVQKHEGDSSQQ